MDNPLRPKSDENDEQESSVSTILKVGFIAMLLIAILLIIPIYKKNTVTESITAIEEQIQTDDIFDQEATVSLNISHLDQLGTVQEQDEYLTKQLESELDNLNLNEYKLANLSQKMTTLIQEGNLKHVLSKIMEQNKVSKILQYKLEEQSIMQADFHEKNGSYFECVWRVSEQVKEICEKYEGSIESVREVEELQNKLLQANTKEQEIKEQDKIHTQSYKQQLNDLEIELGNQQNAISQSENLLFQIDRRQKENQELEEKINQFEEEQPLLKSQLELFQDQLNETKLDLQEKNQQLEEFKENITVIKMEIDSIEMTGNITYILDKISGRDKKKNNELTQIVRERIHVLNQMIEHKGLPQELVEVHRKTIQELSEQYLNNMVIMNSLISVQQFKEIYKQKKDLLILNIDQSKDFLKKQYSSLEEAENQYENIKILVNILESNCTKIKLELSNNVKQLDYFYQVKLENEKIIMSEEDETKNSTKLYEQLSKDIEKLKNSHQKKEENFDEQMKQIIMKKAEIEQEIEQLQDKERDHKLILKELIRYLNKQIFECNFEQQFLISIEQNSQNVIYDLKKNMQLVHEYQKDIIGILNKLQFRSEFA